MEKQKLVSAVFVENKNSWRISFTEPLINNATHKLFLIASIDKKSILDIVLNGQKNFEKYPAQMIENPEWFVTINK